MDSKKDEEKEKEKEEEEKGKEKEKLKDETDEKIKTIFKTPPIMWCASSFFRRIE